jgi:hypothetical protein
MVEHTQPKAERDTRRILTVSRTTFVVTELGEEERNENIRMVKINRLKSLKKL